MSTTHKCIQPCRCQHVHFTDSSRIQHQPANPNANFTNRTGGSDQRYAHYSYSGNVVTKTEVRIPQALKAPHRISPVNPFRK